MVRSEIVVNKGTAGFETAETPDAIDVPNGHCIDVGADFDKLVLIFRLSAATAGDTIKIIAGVRAPAIRRGLGDLVFTSTGGAEAVAIGPLESARYTQADGKIYIDVAGTSIAGTIEAFELP
jgi:hypothetical protein